MKWIAVLLHLVFLSGTAMAESQVTNPCSVGETWTIPQSKPWMQEYQTYLTTGKNHFQMLAKASKIKDEFSKFWTARVLMNLNLNFLSHHYFKEVFEATHDTKLKQAALVCMVKVRNRVPSLELPPLENWKSVYIKDPEALFTLILLETPAENLPTSLLTAPYSHLIKAMQAHAKKWPVDEIRWLKEFLASGAQNRFLKRYSEDVHLMLARAYFTGGKFKESLEEYRNIDKTSNVEVDVLNEMAWPMLELQQGSEVVGLMKQLRVGTLKPVFAPEPYLTAALATMKLCMFPETSEIISAFKTDYRAAFEWLIANRENPNLYTQVVQAMNGQSKVPQKVTLEWVRSASFLSRQRDINALTKEATTVTDWLKKPSIVTQQLNEYKSVYTKELNPFLSRITHKINGDLKQRNLELLTSLKNVRVALDRLESSILMQATSDKVWLTSHGNEKIKIEKPKTIDSEADWSWGRIPASESADLEVWDDEVGTSFRIELADRCKSQGRFLNLKFKKSN